MFEWKKTQVLIALLIRRKEKIWTKKYSQGLEDFAHILELLTTRYVMFEWKKNQILIVDQKEGVDLDKKVQLGTRGF